VLVALHGLASQPDDFVDASWQPLADALHMAIVGVSGTVALGRHSYRWSEDVSRDAEQVRRALADLQTELKVQPGQLIAFGFSQGAQMAFEIAFANPSEYLGAVAMSPGVRKELDLERLPHADAQRARTYVCTGGAEEHPSNVANARADCAFAQKAGANVELKLYAGVSEHRFPQDFAQAFPQWIRRIAKTPVP
jgi:predicted esterase